VTLKRDNLLQYFDLIVGGEDVAVMKPDPEGILLTIKQLLTDKRETLYIGDSLIDEETANAAGVDFLPILTGTTKEFEFLYNSGKKLKTLKELLTIV